MRFKAAILSLVPALLLAACGEQGVHYDKAPGEVKMALRMATLPLHVLGSQATGSRVTMPDDQTVVTAVLGPNQSEMIRFVTTVVADGTGSRVSTELVGPEGNNKDRAAKAMAANGYAMGMMDKLATEHVDAAITGRPFDMMFATAPMAKGMIQANPELAGHIEQANAAAAMMNEAKEEIDEVAAASELEE
jgi:hypothetical protein